MQLIVWVKRRIKEICHPGLRGQSRVSQPEIEEAAGIEGVMWEADRCFLHPIHKVPCVLTLPGTTVYPTAASVDPGGKLLQTPATRIRPQSLCLLQAGATLTHFNVSSLQNGVTSWHPSTLHAPPQLYSSAF